MRAGKRKWIAGIGVAVAMAGGLALAAAALAARIEPFARRFHHQRRDHPA
jgi:hypothetical protein